MRRNSDLLETTCLNCGCTYTLNLDIIENNISEDYIKLCNNHYNSKIHKKNFTLNKHKNVYEHKTLSPKNQKKKKKEILNNIHILNFGKYKSKSFDYVYNKDKTYCYNLAFWKKQIPTDNNNLDEFTSYIRNSIPTY